MTDQTDRLKSALADRYAIERELGSGGMATVYLAEDVKHHRKVAVNVLRTDVSSELGVGRSWRTHAARHGTGLASRDRPDPRLGIGRREGELTDSPA